MEIDLQQLSSRERYSLLVDVVVPRPVGWVSTLSAAGRSNVAPFSFFNVVSATPPTVVLGIGRHRGGRDKDTLANILATGDFVVQIVDEHLVGAMNITATPFPEAVSEFGPAGLTPAASTRVRSPGVADAPVRLECILKGVLPLDGEAVTRNTGTMIMGAIVHAHVRCDLLDDTGRVRAGRLRAVGRLGIDGYCRTTDIFDLDRPGYDGDLEIENSVTASRLRDYLAANAPTAGLLAPGVPTPTVPDAARAVGCRPDEIVKSVMFCDPEERAVLTVCAGDRQVDIRRLEALTGLSKLKLAPAPLVLAVTGYPAGGTPPVGHVADLDVWMDVGVLKKEWVFTGGGDLGVLMRIRPVEIIRLARARVDRLAN